MNVSDSVDETHANAAGGRILVVCYNIVRCVNVDVMSILYCGILWTLVGTNFEILDWGGRKRVGKKL